MEDYEKKYKDALAKAREIHRNEAEKRFDMEWLFPELKESADEKFRKYILQCCEETIQANDSGLELSMDTTRKLKNWLEKQGDKDKLIKELGEYKVKYTQEVLSQQLEKQGKQKVSVVDFNAKDWYVSKVDGKIHDMTYNPADKVEPRFKVGDYIVSDYCMGRIVEITNDAYLLDIGQGIPFSCENNVHLWTIADAKDGDILAGKIDGDNYTLIFKTIKDGWIETYGHYYNAVNRFCVPSQLFCRSYQGTFAPATKEQRDILFRKMKEAGYEWDADKKELNKIEQNPAWSEEDEKMYKIALSCIETLEDISNGKNMHADVKDWLKSLKDRIGE